MFTHEKIWQAIDDLAQKNGYSASGLAKKAGMDPTSFNKSKRMSADGKPRWPSTESISKILTVTGSNMSELLGLNNVALKPGDPVAIQTKDGDTLTGEIIEQSPDNVSIKSPSGERQELAQNDISWMAHIVFAG